MMMIVRVIISLMFPLILSCAGGNYPLWKPYIFDGTIFSQTTENISKAIWLRNGHFPTTSEPTDDSATTDRLPPGTGAVAGICYTQITGNRIAEDKLFIPYPDEQITFKSKTEGVSVTRTDKNGYFIEYLTAGDYELFCRGVRTEFRVRQGDTTLVPIRGGKRMAD